MRVFTRDGAVADVSSVFYAGNGLEMDGVVPGGSAAGARHEMVRITRFEPDRAAELLDKARRKWVDANRTRYAVDKCEYLQRSMEHALKALITADGRRIEHTHELDALWEQAQATGERISATRNPPQLEKLSRYAGDWRYETPADENPEVTWQENRTTGEDVLNHARPRPGPGAVAVVGVVDEYRVGSPFCLCLRLRL